MIDINVTVTSVASKFDWWMLNYPKSNDCYWALKDNDGKLLKEGNYTIPTNVIDGWGTDDSHIQNHLINQKVWE